MWWQVMCPTPAWWDTLESFWVIFIRLVWVNVSWMRPLFRCTLLMWFSCFPFVGRQMQWLHRSVDLKVFSFVPVFCFVFCFCFFSPGGKRNNFSTCKAKAAATGPLLETEACWIPWRPLNLQTEASSSQRTPLPPPPLLSRPHPTQPLLPCPATQSHASTSTEKPPLLGSTPVPMAPAVETPNWTRQSWLVGAHSRNHILSPRENN